jgi:predicted nucleic acid-binding protein
MILADTSVWIEHLRGGRAGLVLASLLEEDSIVMHPWIAGELALGRLGKRRAHILADIGLLDHLAPASDEDVMRMIEARSLSGTGIGWVDAHLLASALVAGARLWTLDRILREAARAAGICHEAG